MLVTVLQEVAVVQVETLVPAVLTEVVATAETQVTAQMEVMRARQTVVLPVTAVMVDHPVRHEDSAVQLELVELAELPVRRERLVTVVTAVTAAPVRLQLLALAALVVLAGLVVRLSVVLAVTAAMVVLVVHR
jgi:hypothetical protein